MIEYRVLDDPEDPGYYKIETSDGGFIKGGFKYLHDARQEATALNVRQEINRVKDLIQKHRGVK